MDLQSERQPRRQRIIASRDPLPYRHHADREPERAPAETAARTPRDEIHAARIALLGELMASITHEVHQPLTALVANGDMGLRCLRRAQPDIAEAMAAFSTMIAQAKRASAIISSTRALAARQQEAHSGVAVNAMLNEVAALSQGHVARRGGRLELDLAPNLPEVRADRVQLQQIALNLIVNAAQALESTPGGGAIQVHTRRGEGSVVVEVHDSGPGLDPALKDKIFEPFFTTKVDGLGMGLAIARTLIDAHHGALFVEPSFLGGAAFIFSLPAG